MQRIDGVIRAQRVMTVQKQVSYDTKENQLVKYILQSVSKRLEQFKRNYRKLQRAEDSAVTDKIDRMANELNRRNNSGVLAEVTARPESAGLSLVFSMASGYRDLYKYYLMLLRGLSITGDVFDISVKDLAVLYEYWCFIKLNSLMKDKYELVSQDVVKVQGNGLFVSLVKGATSRVKYRNPDNGETITLSYNPKEGNLPTVPQRPDNVLSLEKKTVSREGKKLSYEYVFDAKYKINPALAGSDYYNRIAHTPGPQEDDINTMHRYRDAIVYQNGAEPYERTMFGAYVLFPYGNEEEYRSHRFFQSIDKVNIGGLPFLPSATGMVENMLDDLIMDSAESAFERTTLPKGIEDKLARVDWQNRDVLVGMLSNEKQLAVCLEHKFYHIPVRKAGKDKLPVRYVAIYQSKNIFKEEAGIRYYGEVVNYRVVKRREITWIPKDKDELYYLFEIKEWLELNKPVNAKEIAQFPLFTNMFLLQHCADVPDLLIGSEEEYRLYIELRRLANDNSINENDSDNGFRYKNSLVTMDGGYITVIRDGKIREKIAAGQFMKRPREVLKAIGG